MTRICAAILLLAIVAGCQPAKPPTTQPLAARATGDEVVASIAGLPITLDEFMQPMVQHYPNACLEVLVHTMQLKLIKHQAKLQNITVSDEDIKQEQMRSLLMFFPDISISESEKIDPQRAQAALMQQARIGPGALSLWIEGNAYLRKLVEPRVMATVDEPTLRKAFGVMYGEKALVRHIQLANMQEVREAQKRLAAGEKFDDVVRAMSRDKNTLAEGGVLPAYSRQSAPTEAFSQATFALKPGQVSEPVHSGEFYHLIKLEQIIPPKIVKFEDPEIQKAVREAYIRSTMGKAMINYREMITWSARDQIAVALPALRERFEAERAKQKAKEISKAELNRQWEEAAAKAAADATTHPTTTASPTTQTGAAAPTTAERPPATMPKGQ